MASSRSSRARRDHPSIAYATSTPADRIARLQSAIDSGAVALEFDEQRGYLPSLLRALEIPVSSQGLVFSRTSLQVDRIAPWTPRAVYFNDDAYVGWVQDGPIMEVATVDPALGAVFYTLKQEKGSRPVFERQGRTCLQCHDSSSTTGGVPGLIMRSVFADRYGYVVPSDQGVTTDRTPLADRWGGWYVTGTLGSQPHMGNVIAPLVGHDIVNPAAYLTKLRAQPQSGVDRAQRPLRSGALPGAAQRCGRPDGARASDVDPQPDHGGDLRGTACRV